MPQLDPSSFPSQLFWLAVTFVVLLVLMTRIGLPQVCAVIDARAAKIDGDLGVATDARNRATTLLAEYERALSAARTEAQATIREMAETMAKEQATQEQELLGRLAVEARAAEARIGKARDGALAGVRQIAVEIVEALTVRLVGEPVATGGFDEAVASILAERRR